MRDSQSTLDAAFDYASLGYAVFPCVPKGKRPLIKHGLKEASVCPRQIKTWWQRWPSANLAVLPPEHVLVLDFDDRAIAERWLKNYPELRRASRTRTPRGGLHCWLKLAEDVNPDSLKTRTKAAGGEVDLRGLGRAYLIAPPSHTADGNYGWEQPLVSPARLPCTSRFLLQAITPIPAEDIGGKVAESLPTQCGSRARRYALAALEAEHDVVATTNEGARNDRLNRAAYSLGGYAAHDLLSFEEIEEVLLSAAQTCGLPKTEALRTIASGLQAGFQAPRSLPNLSRM